MITRRAEENIHLTQPVPYISKTIHGDMTSYVVKGECSMSIDQLGQRIQFSQYPGLTFSSMESAFNYFEAHAKLQQQRAIKANGQLAGQCNQSATQQARRPVALDPCERIWQFDASLEPTNLKPVVRLPTRSHPGIRDPPSESAAETVSQDTWKALDPVHSMSRSSPPEIPPQTLFAESTPHARYIQAQPKPRVKLPMKELQSSPFHSQPTNDSSVQQPLPSLPQSYPAKTLFEDDTAPHAYHSLCSPSYPSKDDEILAQPQSSYGSCPLPSSYSATVLPQTLAKKDMRVLGVPLTADIDEYVRNFYARFPPARPRHS